MDTTHAFRAYDHLRQKLAGGELPPGSRLRYGPIGREIGVSATPVREAIGRLASEGFVEVRANQGAVVRSPERHELIELYQVREALEALAAGNAARSIDGTALDELAQRVQAMREIALDLRRSDKATLSPEQMRRFLSEDVAFHLIVLEAANNRLMLRTVNTLQLMSRIFLDFKRPRHRLAQVASAYAMHNRILKAMRRGDTQRASEAMAQHIRKGLQATLAMFDAQQRSRLRREFSGDRNYSGMND